MTYIWKEWKELSRGKGLWLALSTAMIISVFILWQSKSLPSNQGFEVYLVSLYEMNVFLIPLLSLFISSFAVIQEKEQKTLMIILTKKESYRSFFLKKTIGVQLITVLMFLCWYFALALPMKFVFFFHVSSFWVFLLTFLTLLIIFNQIGLFLGSICDNRMQLIGANILTWFFFIFILDLLFLYFLPRVNEENITAFSVVYFLDPLHTLHFYLETALGLYPLDHMSRLMKKMVWLPPKYLLPITLLVWLTLSFELSIRLRRRGGIS
ncbi:ABC transporter permease subunit [Neobacillus drentensis]|uniref:ABC transporter permease subunit n=1 Tax=Neobacillus drentensis TaxID=220684 RepID=UPI002FFFD422